MTHREMSVVGEQLDDLDAQVLDAARVYLAFGAAPLPETVRVLADHLQVRQVDQVTAAVLAAVAGGELHYSGSGMVSLPAGSGARGSEEGDAS